jgi:hypothetical protein
MGTEGRFRDLPKINRFKSVDGIAVSEQILWRAIGETSIDPAKWRLGRDLNPLVREDCRR